MELSDQMLIIQGLFIWSTVVHVHGKDGCANRTDSVEWMVNENWPIRLYQREWFTVNCRVTNRDGIIAELLHDDKPRVGKRIQNNDNVFNITIITSNDYGDYDCKVCGQKRGIEKTVEPLNAGRPFQRPKILNKPENGLVDYGQTVTMYCEINGHYSFNWYKSKRLYSTYTSMNRGTINYTKRLELKIENFSKSKEGWYLCKATRELVQWKSEDKVRLQMKAFTKAKLENFPEGPVKTLKEGESLHEEITVSGSPPPRNWGCWEMPKDERAKEIKKTDHSIFINITKVSYLRNNGTRFECNATNINGSTSKYFYLNVLVKPTVNVEQKIRLLQDKPINLTCKVHSANPVPTINWTYSEDNDNNSQWLSVTSLINHQMIRVDEKVLHIERQSESDVWYKCTARNSEGVQSFTWHVINKKPSKNPGAIYTEKKYSSYLLASIVVSVIIVLFLLFVIIVLYKRKKKYGGFYILTLPPPQDYLKIVDQNKSLQEQSGKLPYLSEWEFPIEKITLLQELGSGAFGVVYLADAIGITSFSPRTVLNEKKNRRRFSFATFSRKTPHTFDDIVVKTAVKTVKDNYNESELADIHAELKILIHVGEHDNILKILGASTQGNDSKPLIILEYCPHGNLRDFLRSKRDIYKPEWNQIEDTQLSITDLVLFAFQVSRGMEFLISRKCIHRDLAARNVLVGEGYVAKISDFGLARDVYQDLEYVKKTSGLLPLKWMAIEAIKDRVFNEKTDVWSYGILLWEMFTLGGTPYPGVHSSVFLETLENGERMNAPKFCPENMAEMMKNCWNANPEERPSFSSIVDELEQFCDSNTKTGPKVVYQNLRQSDDFKTNTVDVQITFS